MGIYIKGMEMPRECDLCEIWSLCWAEMPFWEDRREDCPLVEVKAPHGRLIDADKAVKDYHEYGISHSYDANDLPDIMEDCPTVIEAEVE